VLDPDILKGNRESCTVYARRGEYSDMCRPLYIMLFKHFVQHFSEALSILVAFFKKIIFFLQKIKLETLLYY